MDPCCNKGQSVYSPDAVPLLPRYTARTCFLGFLAVSFALGTEGQSVTYKEKGSTFQSDVLACETLP